MKNPTLTGPVTRQVSVGGCCGGGGAVVPLSWLQHAHPSVGFPLVPIPPFKSSPSPSPSPGPNPKPPSSDPVLAQAQAYLKGEAEYAAAQEWSAAANVVQRLLKLMQANPTRTDLDTGSPPAAQRLQMYLQKAGELGGAVAVDASSGWLGKLALFAFGVLVGKYVIVTGGST